MKRRGGASPTENGAAAGAPGRLRDPGAGLCRVDPIGPLLALTFSECQAEASTHLGGVQDKARGPNGHLRRSGDGAATAPITARVDASAKRSQGVTLRPPSPPVEWDTSRNSHAPCSTPGRMLRSAVGRVTLSQRAGELACWGPLLREAVATGEASILGPISGRRVGPEPARPRGASGETDPRSDIRRPSQGRRHT